MSSRYCAGDYRIHTHLLHAEQVTPLEVWVGVDLPKLRPHLLDEGSEVFLELKSYCRQFVLRHIEARRYTTKNKWTNFDTRYGFAIVVLVGADAFIFKVVPPLLTAVSPRVRTVFQPTCTCNSPVVTGTFLIA